MSLARAGGRPAWRRLSQATVTSTVPELQVPLQTKAQTQPAGCTGSARARARACGNFAAGGAHASGSSVDGHGSAAAAVGMRGGAMGQAVTMGTTKVMAAVEELGPRTATMDDAGLDRGRTMALLDAEVLQAPEAALDPKAATAAVAGPESW